MDKTNKMKTKKVSQSIVTMTELVLPQHTNQLGNLLGGQLMNWIDICAALSASKHSENVCVTASVDKIDFHFPIKLGDVVTMQASVNRTFSSSMEVGVKVIAENFTSNSKVHTNSAYLTFVKINVNGKAEKTFGIEPETENENRRFDEALQRRKRRLEQI